jgi:hypothetical protein
MVPTVVPSPTTTVVPVTPSHLITQPSSATISP